MLDAYGRLAYGSLRSRAVFFFTPSPPRSLFEHSLYTFPVVSQQLANFRVAFLPFHFLRFSLENLRESRNAGSR